MKRQFVKTACRALLLVLCLFGAHARAQQSGSPPDDKTRGIRLYQQGKNNEALTLLRQATKQNPDDGTAWNFLGLTAYRLEFFAEAEEAFSKAVKLMPANAETRSNLAFVLLLASKEKEARREAQRALSLQNQNAQAHYVIGALHYKNGSLENSLREAEAALQADPSYSLALLLKTIVLNEMYLLQSFEAEEKEKEAQRRQLLSWAETLALRFKRDPHTANLSQWEKTLAVLRGNSGFKGSFGTNAPPEAPMLTAKEVTNKAIIRAKPAPIAPDNLSSKSTVILRILLGADGTIWNITVTQADNKAFLQACVRAALSIIFSPALKDGKPVSQWITVQYEFGIR